MDYSQKISERQWTLPDKGELESRREATYIDDIVQKDHIQRKLLERLDGIRTVFDGGAGSGRFSTPAVNIMLKNGSQNIGDFRNQKHIIQSWRKPAGYFRKAAGTGLAASCTSFVRREATSSGMLRISPALVRAHLVRLGPTSS